MIENETRSGKWEVIRSTRNDRTTIPVQPNCTEPYRELYRDFLRFFNIFFLQDEKKIGLGPKSWVGSGYPNHTFFLFLALYRKQLTAGSLSVAETL